MGVYQAILTKGERPDWIDIGSTGNFQIEPGTDRARGWNEDGLFADYGRFDPHYHYAWEYWLIGKGRGIIRIGDADHKFGPGDIICIKSGEMHDVLAACETVEGFWFQGQWDEDKAIPDGSTPTHIHPTPEDDHGHVVELISEAEFNARS